MTIRHLKIFIAVAECGTMKQAAVRLYVTQPTVSQAVKELENHYDLMLFERHSHNISLTRDGENLLKYAYQAVAQFDLLETRMLRQSAC